MTTIRNARIRWLPLAIVVVVLAARAVASPGDFYTTYQATIVGHIRLTGTPARQMFLQQQGRQTYLYVSQASEQGYTVFDVSKPKRPKMVNHISQKNLTMVDSALAISETPDTSVASGSLAPSSSGQGATAPESVRVLDMSDPAHPRTIQTFTGVTTIVNDNGRSLIYVANSDGIWILSHSPVLRRHLCSSSDAISSALPNCD